MLGRVEMRRPYLVANDCTDEALLFKRTPTIQKLKKKHGVRIDINLPHSICTTANWSVKSVNPFSLPEILDK